MIIDKSLEEDAVDHIRRAKDRWDRQSKHLRRSSVRFAVAATALSPIAVLLLALQDVVYRTGLPARFLIGSELTLLAVVLLVGYAKLGPKHGGWLSARIRAEILRREEFLVLMRLGPYLSGQDPVDIANRRVHDVENAGRLLDMVPLQDGCADWRDELDSSSPTSAELNLANVNRYLETRLVAQHRFYRSRADANEVRDAWFERAARTALVVALIFSAWHFYTLFQSEPHPTNHWLEIVSLAMPPVIATLAGWQAFYQPKRLQLTYESHAETIGRIVNEFTRLRDEAEQGGANPVTGPAAISLKRLALKAEQAIANEQAMWWILIASWSPSA